MRFQAIREAVQFELDSFHFYKLARELAHDPVRRQVLERLYEAELDHLHELEEKYHAHLDRAVIDLAPNNEKLLKDWLFRDLPLGGGIRDLYTAAVEMERRTRDHFRNAATTAEGLDKDLYLELASEEEEHIAMLETELEQLG
jgi:rubrerythrin